MKILLFSPPKVEDPEDWEHICELPEFKVLSHYFSVSSIKRELCNKTKSLPLESSFQAFRSEAISDIRQRVAEEPSPTQCLQYMRLLDMQLQYPFIYAEKLLPMLRLATLRKLVLLEQHPELLQELCKLIAGDLLHINGAFSFEQPLQQYHEWLACKKFPVSDHALNKYHFAQWLYKLA